MSLKGQIRVGPRVFKAKSDGRPQSNGDSERNMWSSMLDSVASGKKLPEKNLLVLGGSPDTQKEFLDTLGSENTPKRNQDRYRKKPPIANEFALGYTYQDVLDADHEDLLARLSIYLLSEPTPAFVPLVKPLLTARSIPETLVILLLDWIEPWRWARQVRDWVRFLRTITSGLDEDAQDTMAVTTKEWQQRKRGGAAYDTGGTGSTADSNVKIPLSQGEWDEALGLPLCVVCHGADKIDLLEKTHGWREEEFDFVLQYLRTILMKHGSSLIYTSASVPNSLPTLIHSSLNIHSLLKKQTLKHNVIDRDKILIPPSWDSWGKIRVLREGFDVEGISSGWSIDIQLPPPLPPPNDSEEPNSTTYNTSTPTPTETQSPALKGAVLPIYETTILNPAHSRLPLNPSPSSGPDTTCESMQTFLATQLSRIETYKKEEDFVATARAASTNTTTGDPPHSSTTSDSTFSHRPVSNDINEHIGPVQFNVGGIQVDAEDMVQRLRSRERVQGQTRAGAVERGSGMDRAGGIDRASGMEKTGTSSTSGAATPQNRGASGSKADNEALANFFAGLMKKGERAGSPRGERGTGG